MRDINLCETAPLAILFAAGPAALRSRLEMIPTNELIIQLAHCIHAVVVLTRDFLARFKEKEREIFVFLLPFFHLPSAVQLFFRFICS